jgi:hypothetical protein
MTRFSLLLCLAVVACDGGTEADKDSGTSGETGNFDDTGDDTGETAETGETGETGLTDEDGDGYAVEGGDCNDADATVNPGGTEIWYDGVDQDCDGNDADKDGDGHALTGFGGTDCNDEDAGIAPGAAEVCDGVDQDCDGELDEDPEDFWFLDGDGDGSGDPSNPLEGCLGAPGYVSNADDCDDEAADVNAAAEEVCDGKDNNCSGEVDEGIATLAWYVDSDGDGHGESGGFLESCYQPAGYAESWRDCDDGNASVNPDAPELCDGLDNDCDGTVDPDDSTDAPTYFTDADADGHGDPATGWTTCTPPADPVVVGDDCDDAAADVHPDAVESCNTVDDDCDGATDEAGATGEITWYADGDGDGYGDSGSSSTSCEAPVGTVADGSDCDDASSAISPGATEACNAADDDCDGAVDETGATGESDWYVDADSDGYGDTSLVSTQCDAPSGSVATGGDCDDADATVSPAATELCDAVDQDCDGSTTDDAGTALWTDTSGSTDVSSILSAGTVALPVSVGDAATSTLVVSAGTLTLCDGTWYARLSFSDPASDVTVRGRNGAASTTITTANDLGGPNGSVVTVSNSTLTLEGLTITGGNGVSGTAGGGLWVNRDTSHGGLPSVPNLSLVDAVVSGNESRYGGGAVIYGYGWLDLVDSTIEDNSASIAGGGVWLQNVGMFSCTATALGAAGVRDNVAPTAGGAYLASKHYGDVSSLGCDWGDDSAGDDNSVYDIQQNPSATDAYCYPNATSLSESIECSLGSCTSTTDPTCP